MKLEPSVYNNHLPAIAQIAIENQLLIRRCLKLGLIKSAKDLNEIDASLSCLFFKSQLFDFVEAASSGFTLFVGEGNFSFSLCVAKRLKTSRSHLVVSSFESREKLSIEALKNLEKLKALDVIVRQKVDATKLSNSFGNGKFDNIIFQFPNAGSREPVEGRNPNYILVRDFLKSARLHLTRRGRAVITVVDSPYYKGAFQLEEAARKAGFTIIVEYSFEPSNFPSYNHTATNEEENMLNNHEKFSTWIFQR